MAAGGVNVGGHTLTTSSFILAGDGFGVEVDNGTLAVTGSYGSNADWTENGNGTLLVQSGATNTGVGNLYVQGRARLNAEIGGSLYVGQSGDDPGPETVYCGTRQQFDGLQVNYGGTLAVDAGGNKPIFANSVEFPDGGATIDLADSGMAAGTITDGAGSSLRQIISMGEIASKREPPPRRNWHIMAASEGWPPSEFYGESVDSGASLIMYTYAGDANMDGSVTTADADIVEANMGMTDADWAEGDFNYDGTVDSSDLAIVEANLGDSGLGDGEGAALPGAFVPEPGGLLLVIGSFGGFSRRKPPPTSEYFTMAMPATHCRELSCRHLF